ncbi:sensor histidine kinase [Desulfosarcina sp.]|uniref:sensor histidine kinase n=1 Tax=Desulfosarcina sp. TaxID=2027861 RepID=UPI003970845F
MKDDSLTLAVEGTRFFGEICASISHEIKNTLAIINENAGLLQDMLQMNAKGLPLSPERLSGLSQSIARQVARGDRIVGAMNRFAHSADKPSETVDVDAVIRFIVDLAARLIIMRKAVVQIEAPPRPVTIVTHRFFLENLVWGCLCRAMDACAPGQPVRIFIQKMEKSVQIGFGGLARDCLAAGVPFPSPREKQVADFLGAQLRVDQKQGQINLNLP